MQKQNSAEVQYQIPRYLGLREIKKRKGAYEVSLGFALKNRVDLVLDQPGLDLLVACQEPISIAQLRRKLKAKNREVQDCLDVLLKAKAIVEIPTVPEDFTRYDRHLLFYQLSGLDPVEAQRKISQSTIALIGVGGIGNWASLAAIGAGFKEIRLIDFDTIELSNLTRQVLFKERDLGKTKLKVAGEELTARNSKTKIVPFDMKVSSAKQLSKILKGVDFVILSADRPEEIHDWVDDVCIKQKIPYLNLGYRDHEGVIGPLTVAKKTSCYQCFKPAPVKNSPAKRKAGALRPNYQAPSFGPLNAIVSALGVNEMIKYIVGMEAQSFATELAVDPHTLEVTRTPYGRDPHCWHCG